MKIAIFGGSFDPIHNAHLSLAYTALDYVDQVSFVPVGQPYQRVQGLHSTPDERVAMIQECIRTEPRFTLNCTELQRKGPSYTIDTLQDLDAAQQYFLLIGGDQLANFCTWKNWQGIIDRVTLLVGARGPLTVPAALCDYLQQRQQHLVQMAFTPMLISSTLIRQKMASGEPINDLVPASVLQYIQQHHLYQTL